MPGRKEARMARMASDVKFLLFNSWNSGIKIKYPAGWKKQSAWLSVKIVFTEPEGRCSVMINGKDLPRKGMPLAEYVGEYVRNLVQDQIKPTTSAATLAGLPARMVSYTEEQDGKPVKMMFVIAVRKDAAYVVGYAAKAGDYNTFLIVSPKVTG